QSCSNKRRHLSWSGSCQEMFAPILETELPARIRSDEVSIAIHKRKSPAHRRHLDFRVEIERADRRCADPGCVAAFQSPLHESGFARPESYPRHPARCEATRQTHG